MVVVVVVVVDKDYSLTSQRRVARSHCFPGAPAWVVGQTRTLYRPAPKDTHHACARVEMDEGGVGVGWRCIPTSHAKNPRCHRRTVYQPILKPIVARRSLTFRGPYGNAAGSGISSFVTLPRPTTTAFTGAVGILFTCERPCVKRCWQSCKCKQQSRTAVVEVHVLVAQVLQTV